MSVTKISPTAEELAELAKTIPPGPIVIINLIKFKPGEEARAAYVRYMEGSRPAANPDMEVIHAGKAAGDVGAGEDWDYSIIARYRQFADFVGVVTSDAWREADRHRAQAIARTLMIVTPVEDLGSVTNGE